MTISMEQIKNLRERTGAGIADVKKALEESGGELDAAAEILRKKGIAKAAKREDREASEGIILAGTNESGTEGYMVEINSETDFVARNEQFQAFAKTIFELVKTQKPQNVDALLNLNYDAASVKEKVESLSGVIGEKLAVSNVAILENTNGQVASYIHAEGRIGVLVSLTGGTVELARDIAMQVAAANPKFLNTEEAKASGAAEIEKEKEIYREQLKNENKPEAMWDKIIEGKLQKYFQGICLLEQEYIKDDSKKVRDILGVAMVEKFVRFALA
jgi:elongation factor Ts